MSKYTERDMTLDDLYWGARGSDLAEARKCEAELKRRAAESAIGEIDLRLTIVSKIREMPKIVLLSHAKDDESWLQGVAIKEIARRKREGVWGS